MSTLKTTLLTAVLAFSCFQLSGCAAALVGGAAAGAAGGVAYSDRGAKGDVKGDPHSVSQKAQNVFSDMNIQTTGTQTQGSELDLSGKSGNKDVTVQMTPGDNGTTHVEVIAKEGTVKWNKDYAKQILTQIVQKS